MTSNAIFYTFSTIAQALAGVIALLGAFVLYRLQFLRDQIESDSRHIAGGYMIVNPGYQQAHADTATSLLREGRYREVLEFARRTELPAGVARTEMEQGRLGLNLGRKRSLLATFVVSLALTVGLIVASVGVLAAAPAIVECPAGPHVVFVVGLAWFAVCTGSHCILIYKALR